MDIQKLYYDEIDYLLYCFTLSDKKEYVHVFDEEKDAPFWDESWTRYFDETNKTVSGPHYKKPYSVIMSIRLLSSEFFYEDFDGRYCNYEFLGDILNREVFSWIKIVDNLDADVLFALMQCGISLDTLPKGGWKKITPDFLEKQGELVRKQILQAEQAKKRSWGNYQEYLKTDHWQSQRKAALKSANYRCMICNSGNKQLDVHHRTYERLGSELPADLIVLCNDCHTLFHKNGRLKDPK